jgi:hypothetical protein
VNAVCQLNVKMPECFVVVERFGPQTYQKCHQILQWRKPFRGQLFCQLGAPKFSCDIVFVEDAYSDMSHTFIEENRSITFFSVVTNVLDLCDNESPDITVTIEQLQA